MNDNPVLVKPPRTANFTAEEDLRLASAYVFVSLDAAVGTDQDGNTFWTKIRDSFVNRGGLVARTMQSLKARWNKVINAEIGKYVGHLQGVFREYHSGWAMGDYVTKAKGDFQRTQGKAFKHEVIYNMLRTKMPKYEVEVESIDQRVVRALFLLDSDNTAETQARAEEQEAGIADTAAGVITGNADHDADDAFDLEGSSSSDKASDVAAAPAAPGRTAAISYQMQHSYTTPRPSIGKKKAKAIAVAANNKNKRTKVELTAATVLEENRNREKKIRNESLSRIASAAEAKNQLAKDQMMLQLFLLNPTSAAAVAFFEAKALEYSIALPTGGITAAAEETANDENEEDDDIVEVFQVRAPLPDDSGVLSPLLITPAAAAKMCVAGLIVNIDEDDDDVHGDVLPSLGLPDTQVMFGALIEAAAAKKPNHEEDVELYLDGSDRMSNCDINKEDDVDDNIDTQATTLSN
jgi:hypothetical protein